MVLVNTSVTALLVRSTFYGEDKTTSSSEHQPAQRFGEGLYGQSESFLLFATHLFHFLEVIVELGPFCPSDLLTDQLQKKNKGGGIKNGRDSLKLLVE